MNPDLEREEQEYEMNKEQQDEGMAETGVMVLLSVEELTILNRILGRFVPLDRSPAVGTLRDKIKTAMEVL